MSFRRNKEEALHWQKWVAKHRDELIACGIPHVVLGEIGNWCYFLEHGYFKPVGSAEPIIDVDDMRAADAERLCLFLEQDDFYPDCSTLSRLKHLLKRGRDADNSA